MERGPPEGSYGVAAGGGCRSLVMGRGVLGVTCRCDASRVVPARPPRAEMWRERPRWGCADAVERVARICGEDFAAHVIELRHETESLRLSGWLALPTFSRSQADLQFAYLNGRFVRDKLIVGAARLAYRDVLFHGRFCAYVLYVGLDPSQVDVNAHPQKLEVRFRDSRRVHDFVFRTLEKVLADTRPSADSACSAPPDCPT